MVEVEITPAIKKRAWAKARKMGKLKNSITQGKGNIAGFIGEELVAAYLSSNLCNTYDYDLIHKGKKIEVKTKRCTGEPKPHYSCSISAHNTRQGCDIYVFVRVEFVKGRWGRAWILGWEYKDEYFRRSHFLKKGQRDGDNWFKVKSNCYNLLISDLRDIEDLR